jgi:hypothetical protein
MFRIKQTFSLLDNTTLLVAGNPGRLGTLIYVVTVETLRSGQAKHTHLRSYRGNLTTKGEKARSFT